MNKSPRLYVALLLLWAGLMTALAYPLALEVQRGFEHSAVVGLAVALSGIFISYFWLNGIKDLIYTLMFHGNRGLLSLRVPADAAPSPDPESVPSVALLYCTCDDFSPAALAACLDQSHPRTRAVILDDSKTEQSRQQVDAFAAEHGIEVVRRPDRTGFKAGNLNHYLRTADYDYFVILDSDEIIPRDFTRRCLDYFRHYPKAGVVQANHVATRNRNSFMGRFHPGVDSHWPAYQSVKNRFGFLSLLGHGAMVSRECYQAADGFPHLVAEDLCFSIEARNAGYLVVFAPDVVCEEEFPVSYHAFKKRHSKWAQGNMEFLKRYSLRILTSRMSWFEKLDIVLFTYSLPLTAFFSLYVAINVVALPALEYSVRLPLWTLVPTLLFVVAPMLNDIISLRSRMSIRQLGSYLGHSMLLYGSMFFTGLRASLTSLFGSAVFIVTPKEQERMTLRQAVSANWTELVFGVALAATSLWFTHSVLPVLLLVLPSFAVLYLARMHQRAAASGPAGPQQAVEG